MEIRYSFFVWRFEHVQVRRLAAGQRFVACRLCQAERGGHLPAAAAVALGAAFGAAAPGEAPGTARPSGTGEAMDSMKHGVCLIDSTRGVLEFYVVCFLYLVPGVAGGGESGREFVACLTCMTSLTCWFSSAVEFPFR